MDKKRQERRIAHAGANMTIISHILPGIANIDANN